MAGRGNSRGGKASSNGPNMGNLLNLERVPMLAPKFANKIGKTCDGYAVIYTGSGVEVQVRTKIGRDGRPLAEPAANAAYPMISLMEFERRVALANAPTVEERLSALKRKFELRLRQEFPAAGPASGSEEHIQAWLGTRPFQERLALLMSQKDFEKSYPQGFRA
jgi:hypothetical protein